jgi:hypothetical protein
MKSHTKENHQEIEGHAAEAENQTEVQHLTNQAQLTIVETDHLIRIDRQAEIVTDENDPIAQTDAPEKEHLQIIDRQEKHHGTRASLALMIIHQETQITTGQSLEAATIQIAQGIDQIPETGTRASQAIDHIQTIEAEEAGHLNDKHVKDQIHHTKIKQ